MALIPYPARDRLVEVPADWLRRDPNIGKLSFEWDRYFLALQRQVDRAVATVSSGAIVRLGLSASVPLTPIGGTQSAGVYQVSAYTQCRTPAGTSSSTQLHVTWTYGGVVQTWIGTAMTGNTNTTFVSESLPLVALEAGGPVSYQVVYSAVPAGSMVYDFYLVLQRVGG